MLGRTSKTISALALSCLALAPVSCRTARTSAYQKSSQNTVTRYENITFDYITVNGKPGTIFFNYRKTGHFEVEFYPDDSNYVIKIIGWGNEARHIEDPKGIFDLDDKQVLRSKINHILKTGKRDLGENIIN